MKKPLFSAIPQFTRSATYQVHTSWDYLEETLAQYNERSSPGALGLDLDPDFQRAHVWDEEKQRNYVEFILRGGKSSRDILFNHPNWMGSYKGQMVLVDGKQRLEAVRKFMRNELTVFDGLCLRDFKDRLPFGNAVFIFHVNDLKTRKEVLQWYLDLNTGGVVHTKEEIEKVRAMLCWRQKMAKSKKRRQKRKPARYAGKIAGAGVGAFVGYVIGGIGVAIAGTAVGIPAAVVTVAGGATGALFGHTTIDS